MAMEKKGSLELSLNSLIVFILSIMVFSAGIVILGAILHSGAVNNPSGDIINECNSQLQQKMTQQNEIFAICPETLTSNPLALSKGIKIEVAFQNLGPDSQTYAINKSNDPQVTGGSAIKIAPLTFTIPPNSIKTETFFIYVPNAISGQKVYGRITFCPEGNSQYTGYGACDTPDSKIRSKVLSITVK